jgi:Ca2+-binding EF-hand superfamily protein
MHEVFRDFDKDGSGDISNLEFKDALRKLGIGLTSREIDHLVNYCDESGDGCVNWVEFVNKFALGESMQLII